MKGPIKLSFFLLGTLILTACSPTEGYKIEGRATLPEFKDKTVYMKDVLNDAPIDSAKIVNGKFTFSYKKETEKPMVRILAIQTGKLGLEYRLPVVLENGNIKVNMAEKIRTEGSFLNDRMQDFLLAIDTYSTSCANKQAEQIQAEFSALLKEYIEINKNNVISDYIKEAYNSSLY